MGSPFFLALCLMFVSISEQIWFNFASTLSSMQLLACMLRYVDSRMVLLPSPYISHPTFEVLLDQDFYGQPFVLQEAPDREFWGFSGGIRPIWNTQPCPLGALLPFLTLSYHHQKIRSIRIGPSKIGRLRPVVHQRRIQRCSSLFGQLIAPTFVAQFHLIFTFDRAFQRTKFHRASLLLDLPLYFNGLPLAHVRVQFIHSAFPLAVWDHLDGLILTLNVSSRSLCPDNLHPVLGWPDGSGLVNSSIWKGISEHMGFAMERSRFSHELTERVEKALIESAANRYSSSLWTCT